SEMLKNGFEPGRRLGARLHGIVEPIQLPGQNNTFGLGYEPTPKKSLGGSSQEEMSHFTIHKLDGDAEDDLIEGVRNLFIADCNMILKDCTETLTIFDAAPGDALNNWTCTPSPVRRESW
ncbi:hypothetical protein A4A49_63693, partial [Nicotiana attenuata]